MPLLASAGLAALLLSGLAAPPARAAASLDDAGTDWHETVAPHFLFEHESAFAPGGMTLQLEKLHNRLRLDLSMFAPWMAKERLKLYLYSTQTSFLRGQFHPPPWSNGLALSEDRTVTSFMMPDREKLLQVLAHETTHVLFEGWWAEDGKKPPSWLNEGLAMMEETGGAEGVHSDWNDALEAVDPDQLMPLAQVVAITPTKDLHDDRQDVTLWYIEAYGVVRYLYTTRSRMQFFDFCSQLRDGRPLADALWRVYRFRGLAALEKDFRATLKHSGRRLVLPRGSASASPPPPAARSGRRTLKPVGFGSGGYKD
ncbi:MAG: hypothetical protein KGL53_12355, partial [Elusimicrobia bacterium]|nr:hypothetical protein [Elusimicrobiota bacterium]